MRRRCIVAWAGNGQSRIVDETRRRSGHLMCAKVAQPTTITDGLSTARPPQTHIFRNREAVFRASRAVRAEMFVGQPVSPSVRHENMTSEKHSATTATSG